MNSEGGFVTRQAIADAYQGLWYARGEFFRLSFPAVIATIVIASLAVLLPETGASVGIDGNAQLVISPGSIAMKLFSFALLILIDGLFVRAWLRRRLNSSWNPRVWQALSPDRPFLHFYALQWAMVPVFILCTIIGFVVMVLLTTLLTSAAWLPPDTGLDPEDGAAVTRFVIFAVLVFVTVSVLWNYCLARLGLVFVAAAVGRPDATMANSLSLTKDLGPGVALSLILATFPVILFQVFLVLGSIWLNLSAVPATDSSMLTLPIAAIFQMAISWVSFVILGLIAEILVRAYRVSGWAARPDES